jgi:hypothetical protein
MQDVIPLLNGNCEFETVDGTKHKIEGKWDLIIAHPPCTYLCMSSQKHCNVEVYGQKAVERIAKRDEAVEFFMQFVNADCDKIAIENPVGVMTRYYRKADQYIQPLQFGHPTTKRTGLWLKNLPKLTPTKIVEQEFHISGTGRAWDKWFWDSSVIQDRAERSRFRSKTFEGIAEAMAEQWGGDLREKSYWIESPDCEKICSCCGLSSGASELLKECPNCQARIEIEWHYPSADDYEKTTGKKIWG